MSKDEKQEVVEALKAALGLWEPKHALSQFDWSKSFLQADGIRELNETPFKLRRALRIVEAYSA